LNKPLAHTQQLSIRSKSQQ